MKMQKPNMIQSGLRLGLAALLLVAATANSKAETSVSLTANDGGSPGSFASSGSWSDGLAPHSGANYFTAGYLLRSDYSGSATFAGDSLTISNNSLSGSTSFRLKANNGSTITINNCTNMGGIIDHGNSGYTYYLSGAFWDIAAPSAFGLANDNTRTIVLANINLYGSFTLSNGVSQSGNGLGTIVYAGNATGFTGPLVTSLGTTLEAYSQTNLGGNPSSFNAAQFVLDGGIFTPLASMAFSNLNSGVTMNPGGGNFNIGSGIILTNNNPLAGSGPLTNSGPGTLVLNGSGTSFTGNTYINAGTLAIGASGSLPNSPLITVASGGTLNITAAGLTLGANQSLAGSGTVLGNLTDSSTSLLYPGGVATVGTLTISGNLTLVNGGQLVYDFSGANSDTIAVGGNLSPSGTTSIVLANVPNAGTYTLMTVTGTLGGSASNFKVSALSTRTRSYSVSYSGKSVVLTVTSSGATGNLVWTGDITNGFANAWDINTSTNWLFNGVPAVYFDADIVNFTDAGTNLNGTLNQPTLDVVVNPGAIIFNSASNYVLTSLTGLGTIAGPTSLTKSGTGSVSIQISNTYSGGTLVNGGTLSVTNVTGLGNPGTTNALVVVTNGPGGTNGGSFDLYGLIFSLKANPVLAAGPGSATNVGAIFASHGMGCPIGCTPVALAALKLTGNTSIGEDGGTWQIGTDVNANGGTPGLVAGNGFSLTKVGNNTLVLECTNASALSQFTVANGGVIVANTAGTPLGSTCPIIISNNAWIDTWDNYANSGVNFANPFIITNGGGQLWNTHGMYYNHACYNTYSGNITLNNVLTILDTSYFGGAPNNVPTYGTMTFNGLISGPGSVVCAGPFSQTAGNNNPVIFNANNTYTGPTTVSNYVTLEVTSGNQSGAAYDVVDEGVLDVKPVTATPTMPMSSLLLDLQFIGPGNLSFSRLSSMPTVPVIYATNFSVTTYGSTITPPSAGYAVGQYPLVKYSGSIGGVGFAGLQLGQLPAFVVASLVDDTNNSSVDLLVTDTGLVWSGTNNSSWDIGLTENWYDAANGSPQYYYDGYAVNFNDTASNYTVLITNGPVTPSGITVSTTKTYYFGGSNGIIGSAALVMNGPGTLMVANSNNVFTGGTYINGGTLQLDDQNYGYPYPGGALNDNLGNVYVSPGGTLDVNSIEVPNYQSYGPDGYNVYISGAGVNGAGALINSTANNNDNADPGYVTLTGNATIGGVGDINIRHGVSPQLNSQSGSYVLTKVGANQFRLRYVTTVSTNFGSIQILQGTVSWESSSLTGLGDPTKPIFIGSGAGFALGAPNPFSKLIIASNNATIYCYSGGSVLSSPVTLVSGTVNINANYNNAITFSNVLSGPAGIYITYNSPVTFAASNTYTGPTYVADCNASPGSILRLIGNGSINNSSSITLQGIQPGQAYAGSLDASGRTDGTFTLLGGQTLYGNPGSAVLGNALISSNATLSFTAVGATVQSMNFSNALTFNAGSTVVLAVNKTNLNSVTTNVNDQLIVSGTVTYAGTLQIVTNGNVALAAGDSFQLFSAAAKTGPGFTISGSPGPGLAYSFNSATGTLSVVATVNTNPETANFHGTFANGALQFSWAPDHLGWQLYSNSVGLTATSSWFPVAGSATETNAAVYVNPAKKNVFFQLRYP
jgi:autotransporter-associated beta strand protein